MGYFVSVSVTEDCFARRGKTSTVTPIFFFLYFKSNNSGRFWWFLKRILGTDFFAAMLLVVDPCISKIDTSDKSKTLNQKKKKKKSKKKRKRKEKQTSFLPQSLNKRLFSPVRHLIRTCMDERRDTEQRNKNSLPRPVTITTRDTSIRFRVQCSVDCLRRVECNKPCQTLLPECNGLFGPAVFGVSRIRVND